MSGDTGFWDSPLPRDDCDALGLHVPWAVADLGHDEDDAPSLRGIGRPAAWKVPSPPESVLAAQYTSAGRRAVELLRQALSADRGASRSSSMPSR